MKKRISIGQAKEVEFDVLVEAIYDAETAQKFKREFEASENPDHWWKGVAEKFSIENMIEILHNDPALCDKLWEEMKEHLKEKAHSE